MGTGTELAMATTATNPTSPTMDPRLIQGEGGNNSSFPAGLRVLVVDDDPTCLMILERMLRQCLYKVTKCGRAIEALKILRENKDGFDLVISDVYMPDMDGFRLLELVGLEMDLPVIMMSANGETSAVMKGIKHGACDYLLKPVRMEELKNIWQHVVRRKKKDPERAGHFEDRQPTEDCAEYHASVSDGLDGSFKCPKKRKDAKEEEEDAELDNEDASTSKKPRVVWSVDLHQQFVNAVNQLGIDKAVPKRILELMSVQHLTRENVASHLQKYRLYLKRVSGVAPQPGGLGSTFAGVPETTFGASGGGLGDFRALATGQMSPQTLVTSLQAGLLGRLGPNSSGVTSIDPSLLLRFAAIQGANSDALSRPSYGPLISNSGSLHPSISSGLDMKHLSQGSQQILPFGQLDLSPDMGTSGLSALHQLSGSLGNMGQSVGLNNHLSANTCNNSMVMQMLQQTGSQLPTATALNTSTGGQQLLPGEVAPRLLNTNNFNSGIGLGIGAQLWPGQESSLSGPTFTPSNGLGCLRTTALDMKNLDLSSTGNAHNSLHSILSPPLSHGLDGELVGTCKREFVSNIDEELSQSIRGQVSNTFNLPASNSVPKVNMGMNDWQSWQSLRPSQELGHSSGHLLNPHYSQGLPSSQALKAGCVQSSSRAFLLQDSAVVDMGRMKPPSPAPPAYNGHSTLQSEVKFKEGTSELLLGPKAENGMSQEAFSLSDDFLNSYFKQQQQDDMLH